MTAPVDLLTDLLRLDTTNPPGSEEPAAELLGAYLAAAGLATEIYMSPSRRASVVARLPGPRDVPALILVSHTDVVPVERERWSQDPFAAVVTEGHLWGRGALDMKSIAVMHAAAAAALATSGAAPRREVVIAAVADEEAGGREGMASLLEDRPELLGFGDERPPPEALGEGAFGLTGILDRPLMPIVLGEKTALWLEARATGDPGHGSLPPSRQANVNLVRAIAEIEGHRRPRVHPVMREQFRALAEASSGPRSLVFRALGSGAGSGVAALLKGPLRKSTTVAALLADTITLTELEGGYKHNVVPGDARAAFDCRLLPDTDPDALLGDLRKKSARHNVEIEEVLRHSSPVSDRIPLFDAIARVSARLPGDPVVVPSLTTAMTDLRYLRARGATAYGWVPLVLDADLLSTIHGHDERISVEGFERAVAAMAEVVRQAAT